MNFLTYKVAHLRTGHPIFIRSDLVSDLPKVNITGAGKDRIPKGYYIFAGFSSIAEGKEFATKHRINVNADKANDASIRRYLKSLNFSDEGIKKFLIQMKVDDFILRLKEAKEAYESKEKFHIELRKYRTHNNEIRLLSQNVPFTSNTSLVEAINNPLIAYFNENIIEEIAQAKKSVKAVGAIRILATYYTEPFETIEGKVEYSARETNNLRSNDSGNPFYSVINFTGDSREPHTFSLTFDEDEDITIDRLLERVSQTLVSIVTIFIFTGYQMLFESARTEIIEQYFQSFRAFEPCQNAQFHKLTACSTTKGRLCIYQTYYYLYINENDMKISKNKEIIKEKLLTEPKEVQEYVRKGELANFLTYKAKEQNEIFYLRFFEKVGKDLFGLMVLSSGEIKEVNKLSEFNGRKVFLYDSQHVAPSKNITYQDKKIEEEEEEEDDGFTYNLKPIIKKADKKDKTRPIIMSFDMETYRDSEYNSVPYCISLYGDKYQETFYGKNCVVDFVEFLNDKFCIETSITKTNAKCQVQQYYIYGFNNSRFDNLLLYKELKKTNVSTKLLIVDSTIKHIKFFNINFFDLSLYYAGSLASTARAFKLLIVKGVYPYKFDTEDNIYYVGEIPELKYWNSKRDMIEYIEENGTNFNKREYAEKYCLLDAELTYKIALRHVSECYGEINGRIFDVVAKPTGAGLALKMFQSCFLKDTIYQSPKEQQIKERLAYKGGRTEVFKKSGKDLLYYDINSSYPFAMTMEMPYQYIRTTDYEEQERNEFIDTDLFYARSEYVGNDKNFIPNLLARSAKGDIIATKNTPYGYHWGVELNEAVKNGCKIFITQVNQYKYRKVFDEYANYFYNERSKIKKTNEVKANFYKLLLNSLYGKFAQSTKEKSVICREKYEIDLIIKDSKNKITDFYQVDNNILIKYINNEDEGKSVGNLIRFSSYIASLARTNLSKMMRDVSHENVYYCDTDSVFTSKKPSPEFLDDNILGKWKLEDEVKSGIFLAPKSYTYETKNDEKHFKAKGMKNDQLTEEHFINVANGKNQEIMNESMFFRSLNGVKVKPQSRTMSTTYNKRIWNGNNSSPFESYDDWLINKEKK